MLPSSLHPGSVSVNAFNMDTHNTHRYTHQDDTMTIHIQPQTDETAFCHLKIHI